MNIQVGTNDLIPSISLKKKIYLLPYYDDEKNQKYFLTHIHKLFKLIGEDYYAGITIMENGEKKNSIEVDELLVNEVKLDYLETSFKRITKYIPQLEKLKKKIVIEI